ncbi:zinc ribbon domain-containing protein [Niameybacter massiliensis]|uniref:Zinc ribbon domain-containing protein n=1 Tax=Holtiella tumoricola TaxID=3018743 RepID=A0AA42J067_9FIRM|nr:zinc ribbon domain-containing protein [Holtiella tumoricola]MDA3731162.1 zinc ribbon domain-containing protein [Holtiella tumoricola]
MVGSIVMTLMLAAIMVIPIGLMIALGVVVYKDAKAHHMSAGLWTAVAILAPNFIGVIIYLVVRSNQEKIYTCSNCGVDVKEDYNMCPNCKSVFEKICHVCKRAINNDVAYCPYCGTEVDEAEQVQTATKVSKKTNIVKPLAIIGGIFLAFALILFVGMFSMAIASGEFNNSTSVSVMSYEVSMGEHLKAGFKYNEGRDSIKLDRQVGEVVGLEGVMNVTKGNITLDIFNPKGEKVYTEKYEASDVEQPVNIQLEAQDSGKYKVALTISKASGSYDIRGN